MNGWTGKDDEKAMELILKSSQKDRNEFRQVCKEAGGTDKVYNELFRFKIIDSDKRPSYSDHINPLKFKLFPNVAKFIMVPIPEGTIKNSKGKEDYSLYFDLRFPETMEEAEKSLKFKIEEYIKKDSVDTWPSGDKEPNFSVNGDNDFGAKYGDKKQNPHEEKLIIGRFWIKVKDIKVTYKENEKFSYKATMYIEEQTGTKGSDNEKYSWLEPLCGKRMVNMGEWTISGDGVF
jgi:hypothetical protein